ncbi:MAG: type III pantothenate kinase [Clostridiales bacterium]|jgi:type III pantothenate kinase|nr:type III pantothenate kinase [Clostridiales bacterium]
MLLSIDIGNSVIKFAVYAPPAFEKAAGFRIAASSIKSSDEYRLLINQFLSEFHLTGQIHSSVIASVVPSLTTPIYQAAMAICQNKPFIIGTGTHTGFKINIDIHSQLGADIVANVAAARLMCQPPFVVVDTGTATTFTAINSNGNVVGTIIHPGLQTSLDALTGSAALLNEVPLVKPSTLIGQNSITSMQSGIINGHISMIDGFIQQMREILCAEDERLALIATGGHAQTLIPYCNNKIEIDSDLTVRGAAALYYSNRKRI